MIDRCQKVICRATGEQSEHFSSVVCASDGNGKIKSPRVNDVAGAPRGAERSADPLGDGAGSGCTKRQAALTEKKQLRTTRRAPRSALNPGRRAIAYDPFKGR